jgi:hypothetical protein
LSGAVPGVAGQVSAAGLRRFRPSKAGIKCKGAFVDFVALGYYPVAKKTRALVKVEGPQNNASQYKYGKKQGTESRKAEGEAPGSRAFL